MQVGDADTGGDAQLSAIERAHALCQRRAQALGNGECAGLVEAGESDDELFAAVATEQFAIAQLFAKHIRCRCQHAITKLMAVIVVDRFEAIEIEQ